MYALVLSFRYIYRSKDIAIDENSINYQVSFSMYQ